MRSGVVHTGCCRESLHPRQVPLQRSVHLETLGVVVLESVVQERFCRVLTSIASRPRGRTCRHSVSVHYAVECTVTVARLLLVTYVAVDVECELKALVLQKISIGVEHYVVLGVAVVVAQALLVKIAH